jgi:hypothetical protein
MVLLDYFLAHINLSVGIFSRHAQYLSSVGVRNKRGINRMQHKSFHEWFRLHVSRKRVINLGFDIKLALALTVVLLTTG